MLTRHEHSVGSSRTTWRNRQGPVMDMLDEHEQRLYASIKDYSKRSIVANCNDILFPSAACVRHLLHVGANWNWIHRAVDQVVFERECEVFLHKCHFAAPMLSAETIWLALFFAYMTAALLLMSEEEQAAAKLPYRMCTCTIYLLFLWSLHDIHRRCTTRAQ